MLPRFKFIVSGQSLALGRPPAMHLSYVDCEFPIDEEANLSDTGEIQNGFWQMKYTFGRDMFLAVSEATLVAKAPDYATVLELDRKVREVSFPTSFKPYVSREDGEDVYFSSSLSLQGFYASQHRTVTMIYLHRSFFAQAMLDYPANPLLSPFAPSFLTAYRCASVIIKASAHQFDRCAEMAMRAWFLMYHTFSASIIVGTVVTRSPNSNVASSALQDLSRAVDLFERTAVQSPRAKVALNVLQKLKAKAIRAYTQYNSANPKIPTQPSASMSLPNITNFSDQDSLDNGDDELAIFGGQTRVIARKARSGRRSFNASTMGSSSGTDSPSPSAGVPSSPPMVVTEPTHVLAEMTIAAAEVHPALVEYLGSATFDGGHGPVSGLSESIPSSSVPRTMSVTDTTRGNSIGIPAPRRAPEERTSFSAAAPAPEGRQHPEELRRQVQVPEDVFESFMGYMPNRVMHNPTSLTSSSPINSTAAFSFPNSSNMHQAQWRPLSPDMNGLPKPDTSFDWLPRLSQQQKAPTPPPLSTRAMYDPQGVHMQDSPMLAPELGQGQYSGLGTSTHIHGQAYSSYEGYDPGAAMVTDPTNTLLELGIMTGSDIDSGWLSFMQECGIMDTSSSGAPASSS
ncbi:hypothetical protein H0H81_006561 [Sphagnurus paluster]|uniref:Uncharacterized protein n=1 Tax=Sphagnurus paluster TaxID=117069 RepID=A0A9P7KLG8_9AGAR|nr:hypothetical protein H0H81_006561 [Sphagnurus paluster]